MDSPTDDDLLTAIAACESLTDVDGLEGLVEAALGRRPAVRVALAEALGGCAGQYRMDVAEDKCPAMDGYEVAINCYTTCRRLCPDVAEYALGEVDTRLDRGEESSTVADITAALAITDQLLAEWSAPDSGEPKFSHAGNLAIPRTSGREDVHSLRARALFLHARNLPDQAPALAAEACAALRRAVAIQVNDVTLNIWWHSIGLLAEAADQRVRACADAVQRDFDACAAEHIAAHPIDARWWGEQFTSLADRPPGPSDNLAALGRAAAIWRGYACDPALSPREATEVGLLIQRCGRWLGDRELLLRALTFHEDALARSPNNFQSGYVATVCTDLAALPGTPVEEQRAWYDRAVEACRRYAMPIDDFHFGVHFSGLLLARAARFGFPPDHPDLEDAFTRSQHLIAGHGEYYLIPSEHAAWARLLQGRDDDAIELLCAGLARFPFVTTDEIAGQPWFLSLAPECAARLRARLVAAHVGGSRDR